MKFYGAPVQDEQMEPQRSDLLPGTSLPPTTEELRGPEGSLKTLLELHFKLKTHSEQGVVLLINVEHNHS